RHRLRTIEPAQKAHGQVYEGDLVVGVSVLDELLQDIRGHDGIPSCFGDGGHGLERSRSAARIQRCWDFRVERLSTRLMMGGLLLPGRRRRPAAGWMNGRHHGK